MKVKKAWYRKMKKGEEDRVYRACERAGRCGCVRLHDRMRFLVSSLLRRGLVTQVPIVESCSLEFDLDDREVSCRATLATQVSPKSSRRTKSSFHFSTFEQGPSFTADAVVGRDGMLIGGEATYSVMGGTIERYAAAIGYSAAVSVSCLVTRVDRPETVRCLWRPAGGRLSGMSTRAPYENSLLIAVSILDHFFPPIYRN